MKNRMHFDIRAGDDRDALIDKLVAAGATVLYRESQGHTSGSR